MDTSADKIITGMGHQIEIDLTDKEIEAFKNVAARKAAAFTLLARLHEIMSDTEWQEMAAFDQIYKRLNLDRSMNFQVDWRTGKLTYAKGKPDA